MGKEQSKDQSAVPIWVKHDEGIKSFKFQGSIIKTIGKEGGIVCGTNPLKEKFKFSITFENIEKPKQHNCIIIQDSDEEDTCIIFGNNGYLSENKILKPALSGFQSGDTVTVVGDLMAGVIEFKVNNVVVITYMTQKLQDKDKNFLPKLSLKKGTNVRIIF